MSLAQQIERMTEQTGEMLGLLKQEREPAPDRIGIRSEPMPAAPFFFVAAFGSMRNALVDLPDAYCEWREDDVLIACRCRRAATVPPYNFHECRCGRVFCVTHRHVKVLPLA